MGNILDIIFVEQVGTSKSAMVRKVQCFQTTNQWNVK